MHKRLTVYAIAKARRLRWRGLPGSSNQLMPEGHGPDSLAQEAIVRVLAGTRACSAEDEPELFRALKGVVDSLVSELVNSPENRKMCASEAATASRDCRQRRSSREQGPDERPSIEDEAKWYQERVRKALAGEKLLDGLFECLSAGLRREEIAEYLGITVSEVTNLQKRLARTLLSLRIDSRKAAHVRPGKTQ